MENGGLMMAGQSPISLNQRCIYFLVCIGLTRSRPLARSPYDLRLRRILFAVSQTAPPDPNEKDCTRTTRLESVLLGFIKSKDDLRRLKQNLVRSNTRSVYKSGTDDRLVEGHDERGQGRKDVRDGNDQNIFSLFKAILVWHFLAARTFSV